MQPFPGEFLDPQELIERSQPRGRGGWFKYTLGIFLLIVLSSAYLSSISPQMQAVVRMFSYLMMFCVIAGVMTLSSMLVRAQRNEQRQIEALEELVQLRRWPEAAAMAQGLLSRPTRSPVSRQQGLIYLTAILSRYHQFDDAITVQNRLLEEDRLDPNAEHAIRLGRAMSMLREDHLVDADRALGELRRITGGAESAGLALIEIYRDVKTGHPEEAIQIFEEKLPVLREQLGHRVADAYVLAARAYDLLNRAAEAQRAYESATILASPAELHRRYPETATLAERYQPAAPPAEVAA